MAGIKESAGRSLRRARVASRRTVPGWRYGFNLARSVSYRAAGEALDERQQAIVDTLHRDGVASVPWEHLFGQDRTLLEELQAEVHRELNERSTEIAESRRAIAAGAIDRSTSHKQFIIRLRTIDLTDPGRPDPYEAFSGHHAVAAVADGFFKMRAKRVYSNAWLCLPTPEDESGHLWHRDPEDRHILKVFLNLEDIGPEQGPFMYAAGSHPDAPEVEGRPTFEPRVGKGVRRTDAEMSELVGPEHWVSMGGPAGTIVFADTAGYHKGPNRVQDRLNFVASFVSGAAVF